MKTMMIGIAAITLLTTNCTQNETFEDKASAKEIKFTNLNDRITSKAANDSISDFGVYATLNNGIPEATNWFMDNQRVNGADNSYSPLKYWPANGTLNFYSYSPYNSTNLDLTGIIWNLTSTTLDISYTVPAAADEDFTIATPQTGLSSGGVQLIFSHMLSKIDFQATLAQDLVNDGFAMTLNQVSLKVANNKGESSLANPSGWNNISLSGANSVYTGKNTYMIMPQPANNTEITLNITITHNGTAYFSGDLKKYVVQNLQGVADFIKGTNYLFTVTIGDAATDGSNNPLFNIIYFTSDITPWASESIPVIQP